MIEFRKAEALLAMSRPQDAASLLDQLPSRETPTPEFYRLRGRTFRSANRLYDAETAFRDALALTPDDPHMLADLATVLLGQRRMKDAMPYAREAVSLRPDVTAWHCLIAVIAEALERDTEAREALELAHRLSPADPEPPARSGRRPGGSGWRRSASTRCCATGCWSSSSGSASRSSRRSGSSSTSPSGRALP